MTADRLAQALERLLNGNEWRCLQGDWAWHRKAMPADEALTFAREALADYRSQAPAEAHGDVRAKAQALVDHLWKTGLAGIPFHLIADLKTALDANPQPKAAAAHGGLIATLRALGRDDVLNRLVERKPLSFDERESIEALQAAAMKAAAALESQAQPKHTAEPVAWMHPSGGVLQSLRTGLERSTYTIPLYAQSPAPVAETMPSAWLITGGRLYKDQVVLLEGTADERIATRSDGSQKVPLFKAPAVGADQREAKALHLLECVKSSVELNIPPGPGWRLLEEAIRSIAKPPVQGSGQ